MPPKTLYDFLDTFREQSVPGGAHSVIDSLLELEEAAPDVTSGSGKRDIYTFFTLDAGTTWYGFQAGADVS